TTVILSVRETPCSGSCCLGKAYRIHGPDKPCIRCTGNREGRQRCSTSQIPTDRDVPRPSQERQVLRTIDAHKTDVPGSSSGGKLRSSSKIDCGSKAQIRIRCRNVC